MSKKEYMPLVSIIIIDYKKKNLYLEECLDAIQNQSYKNFEIILVTDYKNDLKYPKLRKKDYKGRYVGPAEKRDDGAKMAKGEILAFIDDDAYPSKDWLKYLVKNFLDKEVAGVGGPGVNPPNVNWKEAVSGWVSASPLGGGPYSYRFIPGEKQEVDDYPSMNLSVRKSDFEKVGGFDSHYWPGEDTKLCLDLVHKLGKLIIYDPKVLVYHHRRPLWIPHLRQNGNFGLHRGFFVRVLPETSFRLSYFFPSLMVLGVAYMGFAAFLPMLRGDLLFKTGLAGLVVYGIVLVLNAVWVWNKSMNIYYGVLAVPAVLITHFWYGLRFLQGFLLVRNLKR